METKHFQDLSPAELLGPLNDTERKNAPERLYVAGDTELLNNGARVSVVGSRNASPAGLERAARVARLLSERGVIVVSGLTQGIDTAAHQSAIAGGGHTIAVLGTPLDKCYPLKNARLQQTIMNEHLAISQFPPGYPVTKKNFPMRNRTMALLADATVVAEAGESSGALHQGWEALRLGRPLFLMESVASDPDLQWPNEIMRYGAHILSVQTIDTLFELLPQRGRGQETHLAF
jgi:DNA processing protein